MNSELPLFDRMDDAYKDEVLPPSVTARVAVEKGSPFGWDRWVISAALSLRQRTLPLARDRQTSRANIAVL